MTRSVEERLSRTHYQIMRHPQWCAFAGIAMMGTSKVVDDVPTACVDVRGNRLFGRKFMEGLNDQEFNYVVLHEIMHFAMMHLSVWRDLFKSDPMLTNIAADHVVNNAIEETEELSSTKFAARPAQAVYDPKYRGWSVGRVYDDLVKQFGKGNSKGGLCGHALDEHDINGSGAGNGHDVTEEEIERIKKDVDTALRQGQYLAGKLGGNKNRVLGDLTEAKVDWKAELRDFVETTCASGEDVTWKKVFKRFVSMDTYFPTTEDEMVGDLVVAMDVSGSCWSYAERFLSEVVALAKSVRPKSLRLIQWDCGVTKEDVYSLNDLDTIQYNFEACGGGGTTVAPVADYVHGLEGVQAAIILTDGDICGSWEGEAGWGCPTLWALTSGRHLAPCGKTLRLELSDW